MLSGELPHSKTYPAPKREDSDYDEEDDYIDEDSSMYSSVNSDSEDEFYDAKGDLEVSGEIVIEELKDGEVPNASQIKKS